MLLSIFWVWSVQSFHKTLCTSLGFSWSTSSALITKPHNNCVRSDFFNTISVHFSLFWCRFHLEMWLSCPSLGQSISTLALDCLLLIEWHSTVTVYSHGYWSLAMHQLTESPWGWCAAGGGACDHWGSMDVPLRVRGCPASFWVFFNEGNLCGFALGAVLFCVTA